MAPELTDSTVLRRADGALGSSIEGEALVLDPSATEFHRLNQVGTTIWELLEQPMTVSGLIAALTQRHPGIEPAIIATDVRSFVRSLLGRGLLAPCA